MTDQVISETPAQINDGRVKVDIMGVYVGTAETWDQETPTETTFYNFIPNSDHKIRFPPWAEMDLKFDPYVGTLRCTNAEEDEQTIPFIFHLSTIFVEN